MQLLSTKLSIPPLRSRLVVRSRLVHELNQGLDCGFVLISAPAGYGKSTLLRAWFSQLEWATAWLSLDNGDNHPVRFLTYLIAALRKIDPSVGEDLENSLRSSPLPEVEILLTPLVNELAQVERPFCLVLDDYHVIQNQLVHQAVSFLLEHRPSSLHLAIATRADPPLPLARLRARSAMLELRQADLCFTTQEAADFLNHTMGLQISSENVARITRRTEGWIAGLQMAAMSMQGRLKEQGPEGVSHFIASFGGSNRFILDYLMKEVIDQQPVEMQDFLHKTSILEKFTARLCDALLDRQDSQAILDQAEQANLFLIPLDDERQWYRYHQLFAEHLRKHLKHTQPALITELHQRASNWYAENNILSEAISHALDAGDVVRVNELVSGNALVMLENTELFDVLRHFEEMPDHYFSSKPWLCVAYAWALVYTGQFQTAALHLKNAEKSLSIPGTLSSSDKRVLGHIDTIRAYMFFLEGQMALADEFARRALELLPETDCMARGFATKTLGMSLRLTDHLPEAVRVLSEAVEINRAGGDNHVTVIALCDLALVQYVMGKFRQAYATYQEALRIADLNRQVSGGQLPAIGYVYVHLSRLLYEWNELEESLRFAHQGVKFCQQWGLTEFLVDSYVSLAYSLYAVGDWSGALEAIQQARHIARNLSEWYIDRWVEPAEVDIHLKQGDLDFAARWLERLENPTNKTDQSVIPFIPEVRLYFQIAQGQLDQALVMAKAGYQASENSKAITHSIIYLACQAVILHLQHKEDQALEVLYRALSLAESEGYIRIFVDQGKPMYELLQQAAIQGKSSGYIEKLISAFTQETKGNIAIPFHPGKLRANVEPLSERELEVLRLLAQGCPDKKIAETLVIARETVHKHLKNIYGKLDVHSRAEAAVRARELGLL